MEDSEGLNQKLFGHVMLLLEHEKGPDIAIEILRLDPGNTVRSFQSVFNGSTNERDQLTVLRILPQLDDVIQAAQEEKKREAAIIRFGRIAICHTHNFSDGFADSDLIVDDIKAQILEAAGQSCFESVRDKAAEMCKKSHSVSRPKRDHSARPRQSANSTRSGSKQKLVV